MEFSSWKLNVFNPCEVIKLLEDLEPATDYTFKLRAVFPNSETDWAVATYTTGLFNSGISMISYHITVLCSYREQNLPSKMPKYSL